jgi:hypothetical protein
LYRYALTLDDAVYVCQAIPGLSPTEQPTRLIPLLPTGETGEVIMLPNWVGGAASIETDSGVLFYGVDISDPTRYFRLAAYDPQWNLLWESALPEAAMPAKRLYDCLPTADGYILMGIGANFEDVALMGVDGAGQKLWAHAYPIHALPNHAALMGDKVLLCANRLNALGEMGAAWLFFLDPQGGIVSESLLVGEEEGVQFQEMQPLADGYLLAGQRNDTGAQSELLLLTLDAQGAPRDRQALPDIQALPGGVGVTNNGWYAYGIRPDGGLVIQVWSE